MKNGQLVEDDARAIDLKNIHSFIFSLSKNCLMASGKVEENDLFLGGDFDV